MDFRDTPEEAEYRAKTRAWLQEHCPVPFPRTGLLTGGPLEEIDESEQTRQRQRDWRRLLFDAGYTLQSWPKEWGGRGIPPSTMRSSTPKPPRSVLPAWAWRISSGS